MPSNDEVVFGIPNIQCPSCMQTLSLNGQKFEKFTKAQRRKMDQEQNTYAASPARYYERRPSPTDPEDLPSERAEKVLVVVTCENTRCEQYNKIKVFQLPLIKTPSVKVDLSD
jgi:hypothetical protein